MRQLIHASSEVANRAYSETEDALGLLDEAEQKIFNISEQRMKKVLSPWIPQCIKQWSCCKAFMANMAVSPEYHQVSISWMN